MMPAPLGPLSRERPRLVDDHPADRLAAADDRAGVEGRREVGRDVADPEVAAAGTEELHPFLDGARGHRLGVGAGELSGADVWGAGGRRERQRGVYRVERHEHVVGGGVGGGGAAARGAAGTDAGAGEMARRSSRKNAMLDRELAHIV